MIDRDEDGRHARGPGCFASLILWLSACILTAMVVGAEFRLQRIEKQLGLPNCGIFSSAFWHGKTCKEAQK